jgi:hypothetical protein
MSASADPPSTAPPFNECPAVGEDTSCGVLIVVRADGTTATLTDPNQGPYDGSDDTLVGVLNNSSSPAQSLPLNGSGIFSFDDDGLCVDSSAPAGCPFGPTGYEGPGTSFSPDDSGDSGSVNFDGGLAPGATSYFSLEGPTSSLVPMPPRVSTGPTSALTERDATLGGTVNPNGEPTTYSFEYGTDDTYGSQTSTTDLPDATPENGGADQPVLASIDSLSSATTYHYRLVAYNADGTSYGNDETFTTPSSQPTGCPPYMVIDSRGSGQPNGHFSPPGKAFATEFQARHAPDRVARLWNPYPAVGLVGSWRELLNGIGALLNTSKVGAYHDSVVQGKQWLSAEVRSEATICPSTKLLLTGYSQGAQVTGDVYQRSIGPALRKHIIAVALFGDPYFNPTDRNADRGNYRRSGLFPDRSGVLGRRKKFGGDSRVVSYCHNHDPICQISNGAVSLAELAKYKLTKHANYPPDAKSAARGF